MAEDAVSEAYLRIIKNIKKISDLPCHDLRPFCVVIVNVAPTVKDGIIELGDGFIPVCFEWNAVEGADGYQIWEESKSRSEETYHEPEYDSASYTSETYYLANAQENNIDFRIKVRAGK